MVKFIYDHLPCYEVARNDDGLFDVFEIYTRNQKKKTLCLITIIITLLELGLDARMRSNFLTRQLGRLRRQTT